MNYKILLVEDDPDISELLEYNLKIAGYEIINANNGFAALKKIKEKPDLVLLDVMMPEINGYEVCKRIRQNPEYDYIPIIFLTAKSEEIDELKGLEIGGDAYITKPFSVSKVLAHIKAHLRKSNKKETKLIFENEMGKLVIDTNKYVVLLNGVSIDLPKKEFELLHFLASRPERVFTRGEIINNIWGNDVFISDRTIDVHIRRIRQKLGKEINFIQTFKGVGYKFSAS
jgi:two-component system alkaline phosphatase synthesis response regulator PhoP